MEHNKVPLSLLAVWHLVAEAEHTVDPNWRRSLIRLITAKLEEAIEEVAAGRVPQDSN